MPECDEIKDEELVVDDDTKCSNSVGYGIDSVSDEVDSDKAETIHAENQSNNDQIDVNDNKNKDNAVNKVSKEA